MSVVRARKVCSSPRCPALQPCPEHTPQPWAGSSRRAELPPDWSSRIVPRILRRDPLCTICSLALSTDVHHTGDPHDHSDEVLAGVCRACHDAETQKQAAAARQRSRA